MRGSFQKRPKTIQESRQKRALSFPQRTSEERFRVAARRTRDHPPSIPKKKTAPTRPPTTTEHHHAPAVHRPFGPTWGSCGRIATPLPGALAPFLNDPISPVLELLYDSRRRWPWTRHEQNPWRVGHPPYRHTIQAERIEIPLAQARVARRHEAATLKPQPRTLGLLS